MAGKSDYRNSIRSAIRGLWGGAMDDNDFQDAMQSAINRRLTQAWLEGMQVYGLGLGDMTISEKARLSSFISEQLTYVPALAHSVKTNSKANKGRLSDVIGRADLWANKYDLVKQTAEAMAGQDEKREWVMGATERHCKSCKKLHGRVYRQSVWLANGAIPPTHRTDCKGFRCLCSLQPTKKPITKGKFPAGALR